ncbi:MAG: DNA internalization-related competence protein ComEC/Rec2, partial [Candidatus Margulisbacteria bacterium]|nr:DNA internalization-related competence protein ComEC/Rec2 [Candidatus Margulisiibacteriota bacterium]
VISRAAEIEYGDRVKVQGQLEEIEGLSNPGLLSFADYLKNQGVVCRLNASLAPPEIIKRGGGSFFKRVSIKIKDHLIKIPQKTLPEPYATLLSSIVFGSKAAKAPKEIKEVYKKAGVAHLLVASGMHLGILVGVCLFVVRSSRLPLWLGVLITTVVNLLYAVMTGFGPSILRAAIMAEIMLVGLLFEREKEIYTSLAISAFIILLYNPKFLFEVGFQLSFAATWSLVYVAPVIAERLKVFLPKTLATLASAALAPVLASTPITLYHFSSTSPIGIVTNMLLLPWVGVIVILGFVSTVLGVIFLPLAELINGANLILLWLADLIVTTLAKFPFAQLYLAPPRFPLVLGYYLGLVGLVEIMRRGKFPKINKFRLVLGILALGFLLVWNIALTDNFGGLTVTILDVGQGDSILVETPSGKRMLIDASERDMGEQVVVPYLLRRGIKKLDLVVMTHPHEDHVGGLPAILENIKVEAVLEPGAVYENEAYYRFKALIKQNKIKHQ